jgi:hypothetical protein
VKFGAELPDAATGEVILDLIARGRAAVEDIVKFAPAGADRVPSSACWTDQGRAVYADRPGEFDRAVLAGYLATFDDTERGYLTRYAQAADQR